jgi:hypothetical protein
MERLQRVSSSACLVEVVLAPKVRNIKQAINFITANTFTHTSITPTGIMDLEGFENINEDNITSNQDSFTAGEALAHIDASWYTNINRRGRWMDLIGDYAGSEPFILDGKLCLGQ